MVLIGYERILLKGEGSSFDERLVDYFCVHVGTSKR